jgi:hypothetical protein
VRRVPFTCCGSPIVRSNAAQTNVFIRRLGLEHLMNTHIAYGFQLRVGGPGTCGKNAWTSCVMVNASTSMPTIISSLVVVGTVSRTANSG